MKKKAKTIIPVNDEYRITADAMGWKIEKSGIRIDKETGEKKIGWAPIKYPSSLDAAVKSLSQLLLRESGAQTPQELVNASKMIRQEFESVGFKLAV